MNSLYYSQTLEDIPTQFQHYKHKPSDTSHSEKNNISSSNAIAKSPMNDLLFMFLIFMLFNESNS